MIVLISTDCCLAKDPELPPLQLTKTILVLVTLHQRHLHSQYRPIKWILRTPMTVECKFADRRSTPNTGILVLEFAVENAGAGAAFAYANVKALSILFLGD